MFDALQDVVKLKQIQHALAQEIVTIENNGVKLTMRGDFEVTGLTLNPDLDVSEQERLVLQCLKDAKARLQSKIAQQMSGLV